MPSETCSSSRGITRAKRSTTATWVGTEAAYQLRELQADVAGADNDQVFRHGVQFHHQGLFCRRALGDPPTGVRQALKLVAMSLSRNSSARGAFCRRMCARMDKPRANNAAAHKLTRMIYCTPTRGEEYVDRGQQQYEEQQRQRSIAALRRRAADLGFLIAPSPATA